MYISVSLMSFGRPLQHDDTSGLWLRRIIEGYVVKVCDLTEFYTRDTILKYPSNYNCMNDTSYLKLIIKYLE